MSSFTLPFRDSLRRFRESILTPMTSRGSLTLLLQLSFLFNLVLAIDGPRDGQDPHKWFKATDNKNHHSNGGWLDMSAQWNIFRRVGDLLHLGGTGVLIFTIFQRKKVLGISWKTQLLYTIVFFARYTDLPSNIAELCSGKDSPERKVKVEYLIVFKTTYILAQLLILFMFWFYNSKPGANAGGNYEPHKDTTNHYFLIVPTFIAAWIYAEDGSMHERLWTFSEYLEGVVMVPQYVFTYRQNKRENFKESLGIFIWIICIGLYRVFYFFNWVYRVSHTDQEVQVASWIGGGTQILFFCDFLIFFPTDFSFLRSVVLYTDDKVNEAGDAIELSVFPAREHEVEQKRLRRRNLQDNNPYQQIKCVLDQDPSMLGAPGLDQMHDIL